MTRRVLPALVLLLAGQAGAQLRELQPGARVRVTAPAVLGGKLEGMIIGRRGDTLSIVSHDAAPVDIPISALSRVEISRGKSRAAGAKKGFLWGLAIGLPVGLATATGDNATSKSFVYALDASLGAPPPPPPPVPDILTITPPSGPSGGGGAMAIEGSGYVAGATVTIGGSPAPASVLDATTISAASPALSPGTLNDLTVTNPDASFSTVQNAWLSDFLDVAQSDAFHPHVEKIFRHGITAGCGSGLFCRDGVVSRAQLAVFLLKAAYGSAYTPPPCAGVFADVQCLPTPAFAAGWIEELAAEGITGGCGGGNFCPTEPVSRAQMAVLLLKSEHGPAYVPPSCTGVFADVACPGVFAAWIEQLAAEGITGGCGAGNYCPDSPSTRGQMAVFLTKAFHLP